MAEQTWALPDDAVIAAILAERSTRRARSPEIVAAVIDRAGSRVVAHGRRSARAGPVDGKTVFEIGSITKVFTSLLLADMVERGEVGLDDAADDYLPAGVGLPARGGRRITLTDLATHTSGLPRQSPAFEPHSMETPFAGCTAERVYGELAGCPLERDIGSGYQYSNLGVAVLGLGLARRAGGDYESVVHERICRPLGLSETLFALPAALRGRVAFGHDREGKRTSNWDLAGYNPAGGLKSTVSDLLIFLAAVLGHFEHPLAAAMASQRRVRLPTGAPSMEVALGWHVAKHEGDETVWHNGGTGGYRAFVGLDFAAGRGAVVLTNMSTERGGDDIGFHLLTGTPLAPPPKPRAEVAVEAAVLDRYVGRYDLEGGPEVFVRRGDRGLVIRLTGQPEFPVYAESGSLFFWKIVEAEIEFDGGKSGPAPSFVLRQGGRDLRGVRIADDEA